MAGLLGIGTTALLAYQRTLNTVGHNVTNVNTEGYSRQRTELTALAPQGSGGQYAGNGVNVSSVTRIYDQFVVSDLRTQTSVFNDLDTFHGLSSGLDNLLAGEHTNLNIPLASFFDSVQGVADDPTSIAARNVMISDAEALVSRFESLDRFIEDSRSSVNARLSVVTQEITQIADSIAELNQSIVIARDGGTGQLPNDLLDMRDQLVLDLTEKVSVTTTLQEDGSLNVFIGSGQSLVLGSAARTVAVELNADDPGKLDINISGGSSIPVTINKLLNGGEIGGLLRFGSQALDPAQNTLGRIAVELGSFFNDQHHKGLTLDGLPGGDFFSVAAPQVLADSDNSGSISVDFDDVSQLTIDDYELRFDGAAWALTLAGDTQTIPMSGSGTAASPFVAGGLQIVANAGAAAGDRYIIRPTRTAAAEMTVAVNDARDIALAAPVSTSKSLSNTGTGAITAGVVNDIDNPAFQAVPGQLSPEVLIRFTSPTSYEVVDKVTLATIDTGTYDPASGEEIFPTENLTTDYGYRVRITGNPLAGDEFTVEFNSGGSGDNRNALLMAGLQGERLMDDGTNTFADAYGLLVARVGTDTRRSQNSSEAQMGLLQQSQAARANASGVNLDEEAADLLRYQQAYQAAAQIISVADQLFTTLISAIRR